MKHQDWAWVLPPSLQESPTLQGWLRLKVRGTVPSLMQNRVTIWTPCLPGQGRRLPAVPGAAGQESLPPAWAGGLGGEPSQPQGSLQPLHSRPGTAGSLHWGSRHPECRAAAGLPSLVALSGNSDPMGRHSFRPAGTPYCLRKP